MKSTTKFDPQRWMCHPCGVVWESRDGTNTCWACGKPGDTTEHYISVVGSHSIFGFDRRVAGRDLHL